MEQNRAANLLQRIRDKHRDRAQNTLLFPFLLQALLSICLLIQHLVGASLLAYGILLLAGALFIAGLFVLSMLAIDEEMAEAMAEAYYLSRKVAVRIILIQMPEPRIVGRLEESKT